MATKAPRPKDKLGKRITTAFMACQGMPLDQWEVEEVYHRLNRLATIEAFARQQDWPSIRLLCSANTEPEKQ